MKISVIIPAKDEKDRLGGLISSLRREGGGEVEIVVADGGSLDGTADLARSQADVLVAGPPGRARQMHEGAKAASGDLFLFLHVDSQLPENWTKMLVDAWSGIKRPAATAFRLSFSSDRLIYRVIASAANWRTACTRVPHGDQAIAVSREAYFQAGGFPPEPLMEEYLLFRRLRLVGPLRVLDATVRTSVRRYEKNGVARQILTNLSIITLFHLGLPPRILAKFYR